MSFGLGTLYALFKLKSILKLFRKENLMLRLYGQLTGADSADLRKDVRKCIDAKVSKIVDDIRIRQ